MSDKHRNRAIDAATHAYCVSLLASIIDPIREVARHKGYAVAVHGSLANDIDLVAVPWSENARGDSCGPDELAKAICAVVAGAVGYCNILGPAGEKPHGRRAYTLGHAGHIGYIDLSIMPPLTLESKA